jgi:hypothetical protein
MADADRMAKRNKYFTSSKQAALLGYILSTIPKHPASNFASQQSRDHQHTKQANCIRLSISTRLPTLAGLSKFCDV